LTANGVAFGIVFLTVGPRIVDEGQKLGITLPSLLDNVTSGQIAWTVGDRYHWSYSTRAYMQQLLVRHREDILIYIDTRQSFFAAPAAKDGKTPAKFDASCVTFCRMRGKRSPESGKRCQDPGKI